MSISFSKLIFRSFALALVLALGEQLLAFFSSEIATVQALITRTIGGLSLTLVLAVVSLNLQWSFKERFFSIALVLYAVWKINTGLELLFFSTYSFQTIVVDWAIGLVTVLVYSSLLVLLFPPAQITSTLKEDLRRLIASRSVANWIARIFFAEVVYVFAYFIFGSLAFHYTKPYYTNPAYGLNLKLPDAGLVFKLQFVRSFIYLVTCSPLIAGLRLRRTWAAVVLGMLLFIAGGFTPLVSAENWPVALRYYHTVEIFSQNFLTGVLLYLLLGGSVPSTRIVPTTTGLPETQQMS